MKQNLIEEIFSLLDNKKFSRKDKFNLSFNGTLLEERFPNKIYLGYLNKYKNIDNYSIEYYDDNVEYAHVYFPNEHKIIKLLNSFSILQLQYIKINLHEKSNPS